MKMRYWFVGSLLLVTAGCEKAGETVAPQKTNQTQETVEQILQRTPEERGQKLHEAYCANRCHSSWVYTRADRRIKNYHGLKNHVRSCATNLVKFLRKTWTNREMADIAAYLNKEYYFFKR